MSGSAVWESALAYIESRVTKMDFDTWFTPMRLLSIDDAGARIEVPNKFFGERVEKSHPGLLSEALAEARGGARADVIFVPAEKQAKSSGGTGPSAGAKAAPAGRARRANPLNPKYTFKTFVVGAPCSSTAGSGLARRIC
jgi:chromosomal replication initiator protein